MKTNQFNRIGLKLLGTFFFLFFFQRGITQNLAVNATGAPANASAILDVSSTSKGILVPRVALTGTGDLATIPGAATSLLIYNTATVSNVTPGYYYWNGAAWTKVVTGTAWSLTGNSGTSASTNFIGTTDNVPLVFKVNNQKAGLIDVAANLFLGLEAGNVSTGNENTGLGHFALNSNTIGSDNTGVGTYSLASNADGAGNTATGAWSLTFTNGVSFNSAFGYNAMGHNSSGANNSGFGAYALDGGPFQTGSDNTAAGYQSMKNNQDGSRNSALGTGSLLNNSSGLENAAIGYQALFSNTTGNYNTAAGSKAMRNGVSGNYNVAVGYVAMHNNIGSYNVGIGYSALFSNSGTHNTAVGTDALPINSSGNFNSGFGNLALAENSIGNYNTALGYQSLRQNHTSNNNVAVGYNALYGEFLDNNTGIGSFAGLGAGNGTNCTFIGYQATMSSSGLTNATAIGANAVVGASNSLVLGDISNISVGIGTSVPSNVLHVKGGGESQITVEAIALPVGILFKEAGVDAARIRHFGSGSYLQIQDYTPGWFETGMVINQGSVGIGTTGPTAKLSVNGTANNATGAWGVFSDKRVKTISGGFTDGLNVIRKINPVLFTYNDLAPCRTGDEQVGVVAQELEKIAPYMVSQKKYGDFSDLREVNNQAYIFLLINAVKEQQKQIELLEKKVSELTK